MQCDVVEDCFVAELRGVASVEVCCHFEAQAGTSQDRGLERKRRLSNIDWAISIAK